MEDPDGQESNMGAIRGLRGALGPQEGLAGNQMAPNRPPAAGERASKVLEGGLPFRFLFNLPLGAQGLSAQKSPSPPPSPPRGQMSCLIASNLDGQKLTQEVSFQLGSIVAPHRPRRTAPGMSLPTPCPRAAMQCYFGSGGRAWPPRVVRVLASW